MSNRVKQRHVEGRFRPHDALPEHPEFTPPFSFSTTIYSYAETDTVCEHRRRRVTTHLTGVRYYGYRYYNSDLGRWVSRDPIGERASSSLYIFIHNNANNGWDLLGLKKQIKARNRIKQDYINKPPVLSLDISFEYEVNLPSAQSVKGINWNYSAELWVGYLNCDCKVDIIETTGSKTGEHRSYNPNTPLFVIGDISMGNPFSSIRVSPI